jgi:hypothetical protein
MAGEERLSSSRAAIMLAMKARQCAKIAELQKILEQSGHRTLDQQANALGLSRSTVWAVLQANHKSSGLSGSVIKRMWQSLELPAPVKRWIEDYVAEKLAGKYGHSQCCLRVFRAQVDFFIERPPSVSPAARRRGNRRATTPLGTRCIRFGRSAKPVRYCHCDPILNRYGTARHC